MLLDKADPKKEQAARNTLMSALYDWKTKKPKEFEKYDKVSDGAVRKLSVQCGLYSYRPPPPNAVLLHGELRQAPTQRRVSARWLNLGVGQF